MNSEFRIMFKCGQGCPRLFLQKGWDGGSGGGGQMGRAIPKVYQGYTKIVDISGI